MPWRFPIALMMVLAVLGLFAGRAEGASPVVVLAPGVVAEVSGAAINDQGTSPTDGRLRGQDFTAVVSQVSWPQSVLGPSGIGYVAGSGRRLVAFTISVTQPAAESGLLNAPTGVTAAIRVETASVPVSMTRINQQIAGGTSGSANTTGADSFVASIPSTAHAVYLGLTEAGFTQWLNLWTLERRAPDPTVLYRDPSFPSITGSPAAPFHLSFTNPADRFSSSDDANVSSAKLTYFAPDGSGSTPGDPAQAYLVVGLQSSYPSIAYGQPGSGDFFSSFTPLPGNRLTFTPTGGSAVGATANTSAFSSTNAASDDDGIFDSRYWFAVPAATTGGTLTVTAGPATGTQYTGFTGAGTTVPIDVTAAASTTLSFPAVPLAPQAQRTPPWVGAPLPATGLAAAPSAGSGSTTGSGSTQPFPIWLAVLILAIVATGAVLAQRLWRRHRVLAPVGPGPAGPASEPIVTAPPAAVLTDARTEDQDHGAPIAQEAAVSGQPLGANVLGPVQSVGVSMGGDRRILEALFVFLAHHDRHHMSAEQILLTMWPNASDRGDLSRKSMHTYLSSLRKLVGAEHLPDATTAGGYLLLNVVSDWATFRRLTREADAVGGDDAMRLCTEALSLVRGKPFKDAPGDLYVWVDEEHLRTTITVAIAECAQRLGTDHFEAKQFDHAEDAARAGLVGADDDFGLWDLGARAIDARADRTGLKRWMADAAQHLDATDIARIAAGLEHYQASEA